MLTGCTDLHRFRERVSASTCLLPYAGNEVEGTEYGTDQCSSRSSYEDEHT
jgi:hypothetical protein